MAQCDWKEDIKLQSKEGQKFNVNIFHLELKFSRYSYIELTLTKEQPVVFKCLINAFEDFGGIPKRILFDNMSTVMDTNVRPKRVNGKMLQFSKDMNFKVQSCKARHAYTKGSNEARNKMLDWIRAYDKEFKDFKELQEIVDRINVKMNTEVCEGTNMPPCLLFVKEKEYLSPLPDTSVIESYIAPDKVIVSKQQLVYYDGSEYSVDKKYMGEHVQLEEFDHILHIYYKGKLIQIHPLKKKPLNYVPEHYKQTLENTVKESKIDEVVQNNLILMDQLLEKRNVTVTKEDACKSKDALLAYLTTYSSQGNWIRHFIQSLSKEERKTFFQEITKLLPYVTNEEQFFLAFKHAVKKENLKLLRVDFWYLDILDNYDFLNQDGYDVIYKEFEKETKEYMNELKESME